MPGIEIEHSANIPANRRQTEFVERKGLGHPDTICDAVMEAVSVALSQAYIGATGRVLHHNVDKGLLIAGQTSPAAGGGTVEAPMRLVLGDRATFECDQHRIPVEDIVESTATRWFQDNLRFVNPHEHLLLQNELRPGSAELTDIFARDRLTANDTSAAVGYAPLTETERLVLAAERWLNAADVKQRFPEAGEDVKVMGVRHGRRLNLTVAVAFVDRFVPNQRVYFDQKAAIGNDLTGALEARLDELDRIELSVNTLDDPKRGLGGMYLTVLGTSAEGADGGQVGRGNRVNGVISLNRPMSTEAAAGKNPVSHVGKIYNVLSHRIAHRIHAAVDGVEEVCVWLCSQIGCRLDDPWSTSVEVILSPDATLGDVEDSIRETVQFELADVHNLTSRLARGEFPVW
jgi:S-adenosylmethionine synthetase